MTSFEKRDIAEHLATERALEEAYWEEQAENQGLGCPDYSDDDGDDDGLPF